MQSSQACGVRCCDSGWTVGAQSGRDNNHSLHCSGCPAPSPASPLPDSVRPHAGSRARNAAASWEGVSGRACTCTAAQGQNRVRRAASDRAGAPVTFPSLSNCVQPPVPNPEVHLCPSSHRRSLSASSRPKAPLVTRAPHASRGDFPFLSGSLSTMPSTREYGKMQA